MLSIRRGLLLFMACGVLGLIAILGATSMALNQLRIGSDAYKLISDGKDLVADILPPPLYVIESYLEAKLAAEQPADIAAHKARLLQLKSDFDTRRTFWRESALPPALRNELTEHASRDADVFWQAVFGQLIPRIEAGRLSDVPATMARIDEAYRSHRKVIDAVVAAATDFQTAAEKDAETKNGRWNVALLVLGAMILGGVVAAVVVLLSAVVRPLEGMTNAMRRIADGDLATLVPGVNRRDEIGSMAKALQTFRETALEKARVQSLSDGDRKALEDARVAMDKERVAGDARKTSELRAMVEQVETETKGAVSTVIDLMDDLARITGEMSSTAQDLSRSSEVVATAASDAQSTMQATKTATDRLSASIDRVAQQVRTTHAVTAQAVKASADTGRSIEALSLVVNEITGVTQLITDIARQTSLLAINAGVEASRAGQDGRGFSVIAVEVKKLSEQTSAATNKIGELVGQVQASTASAVGAVDNIATAIQSVNVAADDMAGVIDQQVSITRDITANIVDSTNSSMAVTQRVQQVARQAGVTESQAREVDAVCASVADHARALHTTLVRIVRTCSTEIDRRQQPRTAADSRVNVVVAGRATASRLEDISTGGARIVGHFGTIGGLLHVGIETLREPIPCRVVAHTDGATHVQFKVSSTMQPMFDQFIAGFRSQKRAA